MLITSVIDEAASEHEIFFLLTAYVEAVCYCDPLHHLPEVVRELPFNGAEDVAVRTEMLKAVLEAPEALTEKIRPVLAEALGIFAAARQRLEALHEEKLHPLLEAA